MVRDLGSEEANALVYSIHNLDPDRPVDWNLIELIVCSILYVIFRQLIIDGTNLISDYLYNFF